MFFVSFKACVSLLVFCLDDLSIDISGVLQSTIIVVTVDFSFCGCQHLPYILKWSYVGCKFNNNCYIFLDWSLDHYVMSFNSLILTSVLSDMSIPTPAFFWFPVAWNIFFHLFTFSLYVSLDLKWVSYRQHIYGSCFCIHSVSLGLLVGTFSPFTFKVIINMYVLIVFLFGFVFVGLFPSLPLLFSSLVISWLSLVLCLDCFFFFVCVSIIDFGLHDVLI